LKVRPLLHGFFTRLRENYPRKPTVERGTRSQLVGVSRKGKSRKVEKSGVVVKWCSNSNSGVPGGGRKKIARRTTHLQG
jgi:hypothetical protein